MDKEKQKLLKEMYEQGRYDAIADLEKDGKIVISKEEYRKLKLKRKNAMAMETSRKVCEHIENDNKKIRKETAEKILKEFASAFPKAKGISSSHAKINKYIDEMAKQFCVDLGEEK